MRQDYIDEYVKLEICAMYKVCTYICDSVFILIYIEALKLYTMDKTGSDSRTSRPRIECRVQSESYM